jgi:hypothetical protein
VTGANVTECHPERAATSQIKCFTFAHVLVSRGIVAVHVTATPELCVRVAASEVSLVNAVW